MQVFRFFENLLAPTALPPGPPPAGLGAFYWHHARQARGLVAALFAAGYTDVRTARSAWEAFKLLDIGWPSRRDGAQADIVLLDIVMPEVDGIEACARIRSDER